MGARMCVEWCDCRVSEWEVRDRRSQAVTQLAGLSQLSPHGDVSAAHDHTVNNVARFSQSRTDGRC